MSVAADYPYLRQRLAEEESNRSQYRHDSAATIRASGVRHTLLRHDQSAECGRV